jgi:TRAP-type C4-dicarboxylate transport system substrate-binding protein
MTPKRILLSSAKWLAVLSLVSGHAWAADEKIVFKLSESQPAGYPTTQADEEFARIVKERTKGRISIDVYPGAQLGDEKAAIEQVQIGALAFTRCSSAPMAQFAKKMKDLTPYQTAVKPVIDEARKQYADVLDAIAAARPKK